MDSSSDYPTKEMNELFDAILTVKTKTEAANFFRDLLTITELKEFSNRWQIVLMVERGVPYLEIAKKLNVSTTTVSRVAHWLHEGYGGYRQARKNQK
jgi:TrpR-related protein YerC/YecD